MCALASQSKFYMLMCRFFDVLRILGLTSSRDTLIFHISVVHVVSVQRPLLYNYRMCS